MTDWTIEIPFRDRNEPLLPELVDTISEAFDGERAAVAREVAFAAMERGLTRAGHLLDELEQAAPAQRREMLDHARSRAGLPSVLQVEAANLPVRITSGPQRNHRGEIDKLCCHAGCTNGEAGEQVGSYAKTKALRWYCPEHSAGHEVEMATEFTGPRYALNASGNGIVDLEEQAIETARAKAEEEHLRRDAEARHAEREEDAAALDEFVEARRRQDLKENRLQNPWAAA